MTVTHPLGDRARSCLTSSFESECYCSTPLTPLTTGLSICWQMRVHRDSDKEGTQYSPYFLITESCSPCKSHCLITCTPPQMSHDSENGVGHGVWRCAVFVSCGSCAGFISKFKVFDAVTGHKHMAMH